MDLPVVSGEEVSSFNELGPVTFLAIRCKIVIPEGIDPTTLGLQVHCLPN